jgi:hypothetical protein
MDQTAIPALALWGYAEGNPTLVVIVALVIVAAAIGYVVRRWWRR